MGINFQALKSFLSYISVGAICVAAHFCILVFFVEYLKLNPTLSSGIGFVLASSLNYLLQRKLTFRSDMDHYRAFTRYCMVTTLTMCLNILLFWTLTEAMGIYYLFAQAQVTIVIAILNFLINRHFTFKEEFEVSTFRNNFAFRCNTGIPFYQQALTLMGVSLLVRMIYLTMTASVRGDAVKYSVVANEIATGNFALIDTYWNNLFCYWEALFSLAGVSPLPAAITASCLPGVFLVIPVAAIARALYSERIAWIAGLFTAVHPRLVEFSCNGYSESFYLFFFTSAIALWTMSIVDTGRRVLLLLAGICFGIYMGVRNEALIPFAACLGIELLLGLRKASSQTLKEAFKRMAFALAGFVLAVGAYSMLVQETTGGYGFFDKSSVLTKKYSETSNPYEAAKEVYGGSGILYGDHKTPPFEVSSVFTRLKGNIVYIFENIPKILLSPIFLFAFCLPLFSSRKHLNAGAEFPLLVMLFFPLMFFPMFIVLQRYFFPILVPIHIFGAAGIVTLVTYIAKEVKKKDEGRSRFFVVPILIVFLGITLYLGDRNQKKSEVHRDLAGYLIEHASPGDMIIGSGYGYVSNTGFIGNFPTKAHIWTTDPGQLVAFMKSQDAKWLILYEGYIKELNPELLPVMNQQVTGLKKVYETKDFFNQRAIIFRTDTNEPIAN